MPIQLENLVITLRDLEASMAFFTDLGLTVLGRDTVSSAWTETAVGLDGTLPTTTRSVPKRLDLDRQVDLTLVREALTTALQAPSGSNAQGWHFLVVTDPDRRATIGGDNHGRAVEGHLGS